VGWGGSSDGLKFKRAYLGYILILILMAKQTEHHIADEPYNVGFFPDLRKV
jgi:hypothetical protein